MAEDQWWAEDAQMPTPPPRGSKGRGGPPAPPVNGNMLEMGVNRDKARSAVDQIDRITPQLDRVEKLYNSTLKGNTVLHALGEYLPTPSNSAFDAAAGELQKLMRPATRTPGEGSMSDFESKLALQSLPDRWSTDAYNEESIRGLRQFLSSNRQSYAKRLGLPTPPPQSALRAARATITIDANGRIVR